MRDTTTAKTSPTPPEDTRSVGFKVNEHWSGGDKAANNINHAKWLDSVAAWAERLSVAAEAVAHAIDIAKQDTPTPDEFADAESDVMKAAALTAVSPALGMIDYRQATSRNAELMAKAEDAAKHYRASVSGALTALGNPMVPGDLVMHPVGRLRGEDASLTPKRCTCMS